MVHIHSVFQLSFQIHTYLDQYYQLSLSYLQKIAYLFFRVENHLSLILQFFRFTTHTELTKVDSTDLGSTYLLDWYIPTFCKVQKYAYSTKNILHASASVFDLKLYSNRTESFLWFEYLCTKVEGLFTFVVLYQVKLGM